MGVYNNEMEWQIDFYSKLRGIDWTIPTIENNTDWVIKWTLLEFKTSISNINTVLFQTIKYLSRIRNLGKFVPSQILLISLNNKKAYLFKSNDFLKEIETQYIWWASKNNKNFSTDIKPKEIYYKNNLIEIVEILKNEEYIKVHVDKYNIVWLSKTYYDIINDWSHEMKIAKKYHKLEFVDELVKPKYLNIFPYAKNKDEVYEKSKKEFPWLIDCLNDKFLQKELWAFYTPDPYVKKAHELLRIAISKIPKWNDYIILDRCAGTWQLENFLTEKELSHCVLSTYETWEWNVLYNKFVDKVRLIIPPEVSAENSLVEWWDALSRHFILWERSNLEPLQESYKNCIKQLNDYVKNPNCNIIIFENPPYNDQTSWKNVSWKKNKNDFLQDEMKKYWLWWSLLNELLNKFTWSAFNYYLKKENDFLLLFWPVKYWKSIHLVNKKFIDWYWFNRKHFHAGASFISCILWQNINQNLEKINLKCFDIENEQVKDINKNIEIKKVYNTPVKYFDKRKKDDFIWIMNISWFMIWTNTVWLFRKEYKWHWSCFYLYEDNFVDKLPLFCAKLYPQENWYEKDVYFTTADKWEEYLKDRDFLKSCLIFTCLSQRNKCLSFDWIDNRFYRNELCLSQNTLADKKLKDFTLKNRDLAIIELWENILQEAKKTKRYNEKFTYWLFQIIQELNTSIYEWKSYTKDELKDLSKELWVKISKKLVSVEYVTLNTKIDELKNFLKEYYKKEIEPKLFEYELLK